MKVTTLKAHQNPFGGLYAKKPGDQYELPDAEAATLIEAGLVESAEKLAPKAKTKGAPEVEAGADAGE